MANSFRILFLSLIILISPGILNVSAQKIQYTRQPALMSYSDAVQLVSNISGYHHLLIFSVKEKPAIYIYDRQLQLQYRTDISYKVPEDCDIKVFPFKDFYYLYAHVPRTPIYNLWKINGTGNITDVSGKFQDLIKSTFSKSNSNFELVGISNRLYILSNIYIPDLAKISSTVLETDSALNAVNTRTVSFDFVRGEETLQHLMLLNERDLVVLKTSTPYSKQNALQIMKVSLDSGYTITTTFNSEGYIYTNPGFFYNPADSTFMVYGMLREPPYSTKIQQSVLLVRLDHLLNEVMPYKLLKAQFRNNAMANFLLVDGYPQQWIGFYRYRSFSISRNGTYSRGANDRDFTLRNSAPPGNPGQFFPYGDDKNSRSIRFTQLDREFKIVNDTIAANNKNKYYIQMRQFMKFTLKNKGYLLLAQQFSSKRKGLFLVYNNNNSQELATEDIRVYDKYDYLLPQLQVTTGTSIILPYTNKREVGLVKIDMETLN